MTLTARTEHGAPVTSPAPRRGIHRALLPLGIVGGAVALALGVQAVFNPFTTHVPLCLINHLTGIECPGCGAIRAVHAVLAGDLLMALRSNALTTLALPLVAAGFVLWTIRRVQGRPLDLLPSRTTLLVLLGVVLLFTIARNLPAFWFLAPVSYVGG
ncbi:hypothetical protein CJ197_06415 [Brachybacterium sp. UMB0905]|nr:hypothetical protein CJ197_06415 [Brachybacterium sp. UMB0905]